VGLHLYRSYDIEWERLMAGHTAERQIAVSWTICEMPGGFQLTVEREDGAHCSIQVEAEHQSARADQTQVIADVLAKSGNTPFVCADVFVQFSQPWFIPRSQLAEWRRTLLAQLAEQSARSAMETIMLAQLAEQPARSAKETKIQNGEHDLSQTAGIPSSFNVPDSGSTLPSALGRHGMTSIHSSNRPPFALPTSYLANVSNRLARRFYAAQGIPDVAPALEVSSVGLSSGGSVLMQCRFCLRYEMGCCPRQKPRKPVPPEPWFLQLGDGRRFRLRFDCRTCQMSVLAENS
jgi:putative protease